MGRVSRSNICSCDYVMKVMCHDMDATQQDEFLRVCFQELTIIRDEGRLRLEQEENYQEVSRYLLPEFAAAPSLPVRDEV